MVPWVQTAGYTMSPLFSKQEHAYRRGFDQGFYFALRAVGLTDQQAQNGDYKRRLGNWRYARNGFSHHDYINPPLPEVTEAEELQFFAAKELKNKYTEVENAKINRYLGK